MQKYPEPCVDPLASARMLVYILILALLIMGSTLAWLVA